MEREAVLRVGADRPGNHGVYYWVPPAVRQGTAPDVVWDWFGGEYPAQIRSADGPGS